MVPLTCLLRNGLCATTACTFKISQLPKARPSHMHLFKTSTAKSAARQKCFAYFLALRSHKTLEKHRVSRLFYLFANLHLLSADSFSSRFFLLSFPSLTLAPFVASSVHILESLTSKVSSNKCLCVDPV